MVIAWQPPLNYRNRPVAVFGTGVLGRRIACVWASTGYTVKIWDPSNQQREDGVAYVDENVALYAQKTGKAPGNVLAVEDMKAAVADAWMVIECVPEKLELKIDVFAELDALAPADCILSTNSSSYKSSELISKVSRARKTQVLNTHYFRPPDCMLIEVMASGYTTEAIIPFLVERLQEAGLMPYVARKESTGLIINRLWAAIKRETLTILAEGVSVPEEIDALWKEMFANSRLSPCLTMDLVGLDTVAFIEEHYVEELGLSPEKTVDFLRKNYLDHGKLGAKCAKGGLYPPSATQPTANNGVSSEPKLLALDVGLSAAEPTMNSGQILQFGLDGKPPKVLVDKQPLPDGIDIDHSNGRMFWTNMGYPGLPDGSVCSANLDGTDVCTIVPPGTINTPKQLVVESGSKKIYFCDREGLSVFRCNFDGSDLERLIQKGNSENETDMREATNWCVGIAVSPKLGKFYWSQKGPSKGNKGRIFCANIEMPAHQSVQSRSDVHCLAEGLPEPVDLEVNEETNTLYWTDRGEIPFGNSLNRLQLDKTGLVVNTASSSGHKVLSRHFKEGIGLKLDSKNRRLYVTDLGGHIYQCDLDGKNKSVVYSDDYRAFTGITVL
ncbi:3-hydroxyacyl-CoA dehydrogenase, NAD binding domain, putative [Trichoderma parareesei]|uniref:3-hydroxyacyl-CoA dehydrogenase, NAD binding domain, putative n=1 Tax=Trichoderma parareesei TaxID=858221 RepID=A0A2H2ZZ89_TRIPA|nr:3-hydroxyacyl-CoA dehydrogenase, NAD binding domain, putative [Trichoderma parareesei]